jgi:hypothetical protein
MTGDAEKDKLFASFNQLSEEHKQEILRKAEVLVESERRGGGVEAKAKKTGVC